MTEVKRQVVTGNNYWSFSGAVTKKEMKYSGEGNAFLSLMLRIPSKNPKFTTVLFLKAFKETAEAVDNGVEDGKDYQFTGYLQKSSYMKGEEKVYSTDFIINKFEPATKADFDTPQEAEHEKAAVISEKGGPKKKDIPPF